MTTLFKEGQSYVDQWVLDYMIEQLEDRKLNNILSEPQQALLTAMNLCDKERRDTLSKFKSSEGRRKRDKEFEEISSLLLEEQTKNKVLEDKINEAQVTAGLFIDSIKSKIPFMFSKGD